MDNRLSTATVDAGGPRSIAIYMHDLSSGGLERMMLTLAEEFVQLGIRTTLVLNRSTGDLADQVPDGVDVVTFNTARELANLLPLARYLRRERPDILLSGLHHNNIIALWARLLARAPTRVVVSQHNTLSQEVATLRTWRYRAIPFLYRYLLPLADGLVAVSSGVAQDLVRVTGISADKVAVIHNPILHRRFENLADEPVTHPWLQAGGSEPVFVSIGRLVEQKDFETLLRAFASHRRDHPGKLIVLGRGPLHDRLLELAAELGVADDVDFAGFQANPLPFIRRANAFVLSSRYEGFGNVLVEALGCGTPVISTDCPYGPAEILENGACGDLVPVGDAAALAEAMSRVVERPRSPDRLRERARQFAAPTITGRYLDLFASVLGAH